MSHQKQKGSEKGHSLTMPWLFLCDIQIPRASGSGKLSKWHANTTKLPKFRITKMQNSHNIKIQTHILNSRLLQIQHYYPKMIQNYRSFFIISAPPPPSPTRTTTTITATASATATNNNDPLILTQASTYTDPKIATPERKIGNFLC